MIRARYMEEPPHDQPHGTLLDEYVRCAHDLWEGPLEPRELQLVGEYATALRDEIVRRMRGVE